MLNWKSFLIEAKDGMKKWIDEEAPANHHDSHDRSSNRNLNRSSYVPSSVPHNYAKVNNYLHKHVKNVWELGDEIWLQIMSGIETA